MISSSGQITTRAHSDAYSVPLLATDFEHGRLAVDSFIRPNRLFTVERSAVLYVAAKVTPAKLQEARTGIRQLFA